MSVHDELARLGTATVYEAAGRKGLVDLDLHRIVPGSRAAGPARPILCGQADNLMVHAAIAHANPGDILVLTMPVPRPVALVGDLLATQAKARGVAGLLIDGVRARRRGARRDRPPDLGALDPRPRRRQGRRRARSTSR